VKSIQNHERLLPRCCWRQWRRGREVLSKSLSVGQWCYSLNKYRLILSLTRKSRILVWSVLKKSRSSHLCDHKGLGISQKYFKTWSLAESLKISQWVLIGYACYYPIELLLSLYNYYYFLMSFAKML
jgi:hypothetical protein